MPTAEPPDAPGAWGNPPGRMPRRAFHALAAAACVTSGAGAGEHPDDAVRAALDVAAAGAAGAARFEVVAEGRTPAGRWLTGRLQSQRWRGVTWTHELSLCLPDAAEPGPGMLLAIGGGVAADLPQAGDGPTPALASLAPIAIAARMPAAVIRQIPFQPLFDGLKEDALIAHTFVQFLRTGDASWPLLVPMVTAVRAAMSEAATAAAAHWGRTIARFTLFGASKRGWTTWLTAAADDRVAGIVPAVIDLLALDRHLELQKATFGRPSERLVDYTSRGLDGMFTTPRGRELLTLVDPYRQREALVGPKLIALGTNDPYWPLEALDLYLDDLPGANWVSYCPNAGHGLPAERFGGLVAALGRHAAGLESMPSLRWTFTAASPAVVCRVTADPAPARATFWQATARTRDFRQARWTGQPLPPAGDEIVARLEQPAAGWAAGFIEVEYTRQPLPLFVTSGVRVVSAG